ncbi:MAG TPA: hypothetical protein VIM89_17005, partial [Mucilaginibacter sp.]
RAAEADAVRIELFIVLVIWFLSLFSIQECVQVFFLIFTQYNNLFTSKANELPIIIMPHY